jgi:RNA recognition motif-containing protein
LNVRFLNAKEGSTGTSAPIEKAPTKVFGPLPEGCTTIYVGNLSYDITEEILRKVFEKCGSVKAIRFAEHIQTKEFRGFGYVQFYEAEAVEKAVKFDGLIVMGRQMNIDYGMRDETTAKARDDLQKKI